MTQKEKIEMTTENIRKAVDDYKRHTYMTGVMDNMTDAFVDRLAEDSVREKEWLRSLFRKSPVWDERLDALIINGTRTHNPDYGRVERLANSILAPVRLGTAGVQKEKIDSAIRLFTHPGEDHARSIADMESLAPGAYAPGKKPSRIFRALCDALHVSNDDAGSCFQRCYAQFADEIAARKIDFKLYVSLNPAHFLTMSNPKGDERGEMMTSCHSLNSTEYGYNSGCTGYARDNCTFIAFTAADPANPETLNNRKTTRQIFAYQPGNGLLLQSRLYNTSGGTYGAQEDSQLYRDLVQRKISALEDAPNLWKTQDYIGNPYCKIQPGLGFGGYADWLHETFGAKISIRNDHAEDFRAFIVGTYGLCVHCGAEIRERLYCRDCVDFDDYNEEGEDAA